MRTQLETFPSRVNSSFSLMYNPRLSDVYFWHFHPEYELVYIEAEKGTRHVGSHISTFTESDLVLIGSNIPHLNFDYGIKNDYQKVVLHLTKDFAEKNINSTPELSVISKLLDRSQNGISFNGLIKQNVGEQLFGFKELNSFQQYMRLFEILEVLANHKNVELLHERPYVNKYSQREQYRLRNIYAYIDKNYHQKIELSEVSSLSNMTNEAFCRYFKKATGNTFIEFLNSYRISRSKQILMKGNSVGEACHQSGFESLSYFNRTFKKISNENPSEFRKRFIK